MVSNTPIVGHAFYFVKNISVGMALKRVGLDSRMIHLVKMLECDGVGR